MPSHAGGSRGGPFLPGGEVAARTWTCLGSHQTNQVGKGCFVLWVCCPCSAITWETFTSTCEWPQDSFINWRSWWEKFSVSPVLSHRLWWEHSWAIWSTPKSKSYPRKGRKPFTSSLEESFFQIWTFPSSWTWTDINSYPKEHVVFLLY